MACARFSRTRYSEEQRKDAEWPTSRQRKPGIGGVQGKQGGQGTEGSEGKVEEARLKLQDFEKRMGSLLSFLPTDLAASD